MYSDDEDGDGSEEIQEGLAGDITVQFKDKNCEMCSNKSKYECPNCAMRTCSLKCCVDHKSKVLLIIKLNVKILFYRVLVQLQR